MLRDLLLMAANQGGPESVLSDAMDLLLESTGARVGYVAVGPGLAPRTPRWWASRGVDRAGLEAIRERVASEPLAEILAVGGLIHTTLTPEGAWEPMLCGTLRRPDGPAVGLVYLADPEDGLFTTKEAGIFEELVGHLGPLAARAAESSRYDGVDETREIRERLDCGSLVGRSAAMARVLDQVAACADLPVHVLLRGPSGSGKTALAKVIHDNSGARGGFVAVNCAHLTEGRALVDLFGARAGAYTGLNRDREGLVAAARGGTLFLDEVDSLPSEVQAQLLTFLQDRVWRRVGDTRTEQAHDVRLIAATNADLEKAVADGRLREDLYYRLAQFQIRVPGLDERPSDVPLLVHALVARAAEALSIPTLPVAAEAQAWIETRSWPGNVRDLENTLRNGLIWARAERSTTIRVRHLDREHGEAPIPERPSLKEAGRNFKIRYAQAVVRECGGNRSEAARRLGIHRSSLYELLDGELS